MDTLASNQFGEQYDAAHGIVRFNEPHTLNESLIHIPEGRNKNPHIAFFKEKNEGYIHGDELLCYAELNEGNLTKAGRRMYYALDEEEPPR